MTPEELNRHAARLGARVFKAITPALMMAGTEAEQLASDEQELWLLRFKVFENAFTLAALATCSTPTSASAAASETRELSNGSRSQPRKEQFR